MGEAWQERGGGVFQGGLMHTMHYLRILYAQKIHYLISSVSAQRFKSLPVVCSDLSKHV